MEYEEWHNDDGWSLSLIIHSGRGASVRLYKDGRDRLYKSYEWFQIPAAQTDARELAELGNMHKAVLSSPKTS